MIRVDIRGFPEARAFLSRIEAGLQDRALSMALNRTAAKAKVDMVRWITDEYVIQRKDVAPQLYLTRAARNKLMAVLEPFPSPTRRGRSMNVIRFVPAVSLRRVGSKRGAGKFALGVPVRIKRHGPVKIIKGAFIANKGRTVFRRLPGSVMPSRAHPEGTKFGAATGKKHREAIEAISTIDVSRMFGVRRILRRVESMIFRELPLEVDLAVRQVLRETR